MCDSEGDSCVVWMLQCDPQPLPPNTGECFQVFLLGFVDFLHGCHVVLEMWVEC